MAGEGYRRERNRLRLPDRLLNSMAEEPGLPEAMHSRKWTKDTRIDVNLGVWAAVLAEVIDRRNDLHRIVDLVGVILANNNNEDEDIADACRQIVSLCAVDGKGRSASD